MKTLYFLRHANAVIRELSLSDFDRPLDEQGREEADAVAKYIKDKKISFDFVMCSAALRARETLEPLRKVLQTEDIEISENFYNSPEEQILHNIKQVSDERRKVLYIGHNPGVAFSVLRLSRAFPEILKEGIKPATLVGFQLSIDQWMDMEWQMGEVIDVFQPALPSP